MKAHQIHAALRHRLFDFSRRNRLLYFKQSMRHLNLTVASVSLDGDRMDVHKWFVWDEALSKKIVGTGTIHLSKYLPLADKPYIVSALNKIRLQANKDAQEYGFDQLRLAIYFLEWADTKNSDGEKIISPLVLLPVKLVRKKGITDEFILNIHDTEAEINPVLAGRLKGLYNIILPETVDLAGNDCNDLLQSLKRQVEQSATTRLLVNSQPNAEGLYKLANFLHQKYNKPNSKNIEVENPDNVEHFSADEWNVDTVSIVLGNFNYRKMSLVRDYDALMERPKENGIFSKLFGYESLPAHQLAGYSLSEQFNVIQADPTQTAAVGYARNGMSYIIQGPPGTGKSQTIVNLIADFVARGKKVLFVCEKRAAIDVVYHRLRQQNMDELCTLIHDSQTDKKAFVMDLKKTAESFEKKGFSSVDIEHKRNQIIYRIERELYAIRLYHTFMQQRLENIGMNVRRLLDIVLVSRKHISGMERPKMQIPHYEQWVKYGDAVYKLSETIEKLGDCRFFSEHPLAKLDESCYSLYDRSGFLYNELLEAHTLLSKIEADILQAGIPQELVLSFGKLKKFMDGMAVLMPFYDAGKLELLERGSHLSVQFSDAISLIRQLENTLDEALCKNTYWIEKLSETDAENAWYIMQEYEGKFFSFLNGKYRRTRKVLLRSYDFSKHQIKPSYKQILENLKEEYRLQKQFLQKKAEIEYAFGMGELYALETTLKNIFQEINAEHIQFLKRTGEEKSQAHAIKTIQELFAKAERKLSGKIRWQDDDTFQGVLDILWLVIEKLKDLPEILPYLKEISTAEKNLKDLLIHGHYDPEQIEALAAQNSLGHFFDLNPELYKITGNILLHHVEKLASLHMQLMQINAAYIRSKQRDQYRNLVKIAEMSSAGKSEREKEEKRELSEGRKILHNEFGKTMRYKSIRDLATWESGKIIRELKPVWLMSPLSVSDTLPLGEGYFDVVIFDEASQITLEEGIPCIYRAPQAIIVGDEMQMPPSQFFRSVYDGDTENESDDMLDADSFLQQGTRKFPSVMLGWHYRSKHESLIGFSNNAFYQNRLLTIPDLMNHHIKKPPIVIEKKEEANQYATMMLDRPISYHFLQNGVYENRTNKMEAEYIAEMVRTLLKSEQKNSIGVVAFSQEQQGEIEDAIQNLCVVDSDFEQKLEEEYKRTEDDQFAGIFFKNLENIQGDERDIIIMSICYGHDKQGKMLMNFGPINRSGGEKRLNVIFSRAKKHVCVVSSIKHTDITNIHNTGANYLKKYLQYAEAVSLGDMKTADTVLESLTVGAATAHIKNKQDVLLEELKAALEKLGYWVESYVGQSSFKCHLGIKRSISDVVFTAGILLDDNMHYQTDDLLEAYLLKPRLLRQSGWNIIQVFSKDWYADSDKTLEQIVYAIENPKVLATDESTVIFNEQVVFQDVNQQVFRLENNENGNSRFWEVKREGTNLIIQYGKVQTKGKRIIKPFADELTAEKEMEKLLQAKIKVGYVYVKQ